MSHRLLPPLIAAALVALAFPAAASPSTTLAASTARVSVDSNEQQFDTYHDSSAVSASGRYVAFDQGGGGVYVRDRSGGTTELISDYYAQDPDISANGNLVVFFQIGTAWGLRSLSLYDRSTDTLQPVVPTTAGQCDVCYHPAISASGAVIAFEGDDSDLVAGDTNATRDVFVRNRTAGTTERVSVSSSEAQGNGFSEQAAVSADGRYVAFKSAATNLVRGDTNGEDDIFVRDRVAGTTQRVSVSSAETQGNSYVYDPDISGNGRYVAFDAKASNWPGATGAVLTYVRDRTAGTTEMVSLSSSEKVANNRSGSGEPAISDNGRYVTYSSAATNLAPGDKDFNTDVYLRDRSAGTTSLVSVSSSGIKGNSYSKTPAISGTAAAPIVAFVSGATNLVPDDTNGERDIFARKTG